MYQVEKYDGITCRDGTVRVVGPILIVSVALAEESTYG